MYLFVLVPVFCWNSILILILVSCESSRRHRHKTITSIWPKFTHWCGHNLTTRLQGRHNLVTTVASNKVVTSLYYTEQSVTSLLQPGFHYDCKYCTTTKLKLQKNYIIFIHEITLDVLVALCKCMETRPYTAW